MNIINMQDALIRAKEYGLDDEIMYEIKNGSTPYEALYEWDLLNEDELNNSKFL